MIAILGATGTLGLSLAHALATGPDGLALFARHPERLSEESFASPVALRPLDEFKAADFDLVINAIGVGDPGRVAAVGAEIQNITQEWDHRVLDSMGARTRYVFLSSGVVHGADRSDISPYVAAKLDAEARHRALPDRSILDLRVFAYADATLPRDGRFFLCELARSIRSRTPFKTSTADMVRDYAGRKEVAALIRCWMTGGAPNTALDVYTKAPVHKTDILRLARERFGAEIEYRDDAANSGTAGQIYASLNHDAAAFGYAPERTAIEIVADYLDGVVAESVARTGAAS